MANFDQMSIVITTHKSQIEVFTARSGASGAQHGGKFPWSVRPYQRRSINLSVKMVITNTVDLVSMELLAAVLMGNGASICRSPRQPLLTCMQIPEEQFPWIPPHERKNPIAAV